MSLKVADFPSGNELALGEEDLNLKDMDMSLEDADLFKYFLADDLSNIEGTFRNDFESSLSDISISPQTSPVPLSPDSDFPPSASSSG